MASRTQIVCLHEGKKGRSIDPVFINVLIKALKPAWLRKEGSNAVRMIPCEGRKNLISVMPRELRACLCRGADTTLMVWADLDHDMENGDQHAGGTASYRYIWVTRLTPRPVVAGRL